MARRLERGLDLGRMMAVVVDHGDAAPLAEHGEAPLHAGKRRQRLAHGAAGSGGTTSSAGVGAI